MKSREPTELNERFKKRWLGYAAASAAGAVLTTASIANADIVTTYVNLSFSWDAPGCGTACGFGAGGYGPTPLLSLDLNHDGMNDLQFNAFGEYNLDGGAVSLAFKGLGGAGAMSNAAALPKGKAIGPGAEFGNGNMVHAIGFQYFPSQNSVGGPWAGTIQTRGSTKYGNLADAFLGIQFDIGGQAHYGWVELGMLSFARQGEAGLSGGVSAFAYNTVANQQILAGQTQTPEPGTLGLLALGSLGLGFWRRRKAASPSS